MNQTQTSPTKNEWESAAQDLRPKNQAFINGTYVAAASGKTFECINPANAQTITKVASCDSEDVDRAVKAARKAFEDRRWAGLAPKERKKVLQRFAERMLAQKHELALLETLDMGKPITDSFTVDIPLAAECIAWFGEAVDKLYDEVAPVGGHSLAMITREPVGVVAAVVPWNFPLLMAAWKLGPALAVGNSVVLKPAEQSPLTAIRLAELAMEAGIPEGVLNVVPGFGETTGQALGMHPDVDAVAFTGSAEVGKLFLQYAGKSNMKRVSLECGGKSPHIILADCHDLDQAAKSAAFGIFYNQGEVCNAGSRLLVEASIKDEILEKVLSWAEKLQPGDPLDPDTQMGAIVDDTQLKRILNYIEIGKKEGARLILGGERARTESKGYFVKPTVFDNVDNTMRIAQEEIFGPVLSTLTFKSLDEAITIGNKSLFGLAAAVWTKDIKKAHQTARALRAGTVWVNCFDHGSIAVPFGGYKQSGFGRDKSLHAFDKYCELKTTWLDLSQ